MACPGSDEVSSSNSGIGCTKDGSNICVAFNIGGYSNTLSFALTDSDLSIADAVVQDVKANLAADRELMAKRFFAIQDLVFKGLGLV
jgi:hypothetical protein